MMIINKSGMIAGYTMGMKPSGRECIVLAVKGTFSIPSNSRQQPWLLDEQVPLMEADTFTGEPGFSAPLFEADYAPVKRHCDITLIGSAYAPGGHSAQVVQAGFKVGNLGKVLNVFGNRFWVASPTGFTTSAAIPFVQRPVSYDIAFGGVDRFSANENLHEPYMLNPVGIGYHKVLTNSLIDNTPAPSTEACHDPVKKPDGAYQPMSFGPIGRGWLPRYKLGGTYDDDWLEQHFPFLPPDFNEAYYQSAPDDQQTRHLSGGETVSLLNVTEDGKRMFTLPEFEVPVTFFKRKSERQEQLAGIDTVILDPDNNRFTMTWRASVELNNSVFEVPEALAGSASRGWWRARNRSKPYPSVA